MRGAMEDNNAGEFGGKVRSLVGASMVQTALNEGGLATFRSLATRIESLTNPLSWRDINEDGYGTVCRTPC